MSGPLPGAIPGRGAMLGAATEAVLLYVEGTPGVSRARTYNHVANTFPPNTADRAIRKTVTSALVESRNTPDGARLWVTEAGMGLLHGVDYSHPEGRHDGGKGQPITMTNDLYQRPSREEIAARVAGDLPGAGNPPADAAPTPPAEGVGTPVENFSAHLTARMRALGWDQAAIQERASITAQTAARAINGTGVGLELAGQLAGLVGLELAVMIGPYQCSTCGGEPPAGYACLECSAEGERL